METRSKSLDILRAVAIFLVLGNHLLPHPETGSASFLNKMIGPWFLGGWVGVDLFFVLSGFLISGLLFKEHQKFGSISFKRFFIRRGFKIYPPFYALILFMLAFGALKGWEINHARLFSELFFLQDYFPGMCGQTWSLAVEEQFYLFLPALFFIFARADKSAEKPFRWIPSVFLVVAFSCLGARILTSWMHPYHFRTHLFPFHLRLDSLFFGVFLSYLYYFKHSQLEAVIARFRYLMIAAGVLLFVPAFLYERAEYPFIVTFGFTLFYLGGGLVLLGTLGAAFPENGFTNALAAVGRHSYSIYLWHIAVLEWFALRFFSPAEHWGVCMAVYLAGSICVGMVMSKIIEYPMLKLRDRLFPSRSHLRFPVDKA